MIQLTIPVYTSELPVRQFAEKIGIGFHSPETVMIAYGLYNDYAAEKN